MHLYIFSYLIKNVLQYLLLWSKFEIKCYIWDRVQKQVSLTFRVEKTHFINFLNGLSHFFFFLNWFCLVWLWTSPTLAIINMCYMKQTHHTNTNNREGKDNFSSCNMCCHYVYYNILPCFLGVYPYFSKEIRI